MKTFLTIFVVLFSSLVFADDISDFQIEGFGIGDSLLDNFSKKKIENMPKTFYPGSKKYYDIDFSIDSELYDVLSVAVKENDNQYIIHAINGGKFFHDKINECKNFKNTIVKDLVLLFPNINERNYNYTYDQIDDGKSIAYITEFKLQNGFVRVYCIDWSKVTEKNSNWKDNASLEIMPQYYADWLQDESR
tara:strand:- start:129 stop:701 length:573 start_codon:yes stop_codon:yes gene_type:complete